MADSEFPIQLERVVFTRSVVVSIQGHRPSDGEMALAGPENKVDVAAIEGDKNAFMATMSTKMNLEGSLEFPYTIDMECIGFFRVIDDKDEQAKTTGLVMVAHSVLFGAIREAVSWLTARQAYGQISLGLSVLRSKTPPAP